MTHAIQTLTDELAYLRAIHAETREPIMANSIAADIADCERAVEVLAKLDVHHAIAA